MTRVLLLVALVILGGCATAPRQVSNVCAVFDQRDGWINNWQKDATRASREFGVPVHVLMATIYTESDSALMLVHRVPSCLALSRGNVLRAPMAIRRH